MDSVLTALIMIIELYLERYPTRIIRLKGNTKEKARLYRIALDKYVDILRPDFDIRLEEDNRGPDNSVSDNRVSNDHSVPPRGRNCLDNIGFLIKRRPGLTLTVHTIQTTRNCHSSLFNRMVSIETHRRLELGLISQQPTN